MTREPNLGAVILCGGASRRMGACKADLPIGHETMLTRIVRIASEVAFPIVVVTAANDRPAAVDRLSREVVVVQDRQSGRGPLEGVSIGLAALRASEQDIPKAFVSSCDSPLIHGEWIRFLSREFDANAERDALVPWDGQHAHWLNAIYSTNVHQVLDAMILSNQLKMGLLAEKINVQRLGPDEFIESLDAESVLRNTNTRGEYEEVLRHLDVAGRLGFS